MSGRHGCTYVAEHMASHGYVVVSADFPLSNIKAPGGPNFLDVVHQPADVSFLIDRVLALDERERPFEGRIDPGRIGAFGVSLGGITSTLVAFHPEWRDPRVAAAVSIAGPGDVFGPRFFEYAEIPFLMIAGTSDAIVDYEVNAAPIPDRIRDGGLVSIEGGTHAGFTHVTAGLLRLLGNPDKLGCAAAAAAAESADTSEPPPTWFEVLSGTHEQGLLQPTEVVAPCSRSFEIAMRAPRQHLLTMLAVRAFFESRFADDASERETHKTFLTGTLAAELAEITYTPGGR
jgi:predicted dienelactone hydrolase